MVNFAFLLHEYITYHYTINSINQFRSIQTCSLRNVPPAESATKKPDADTTTSSLLPSTLGHLRAGADQGSETCIYLFYGISPINMITLKKET